MWSHLYVFQKTKQNIQNQVYRYREQTGGCQRWGARSKQMGKGDQKVQTSSYKINVMGM